MRPDISYAINELARHINAPTTRNEKCLEDLLRYLRGTLDYKYLVNTDHTMSTYDMQFSIQVFCRRRLGWLCTTCVIVQVSNSTIHRHSKTQSILATSSGESEL